MPSQRRGRTTWRAPKPAPGLRRSSGRNKAAETYWDLHPRAVRAGQVIRRLNTLRVPKPHKLQHGSGKQRAKRTWCAMSLRCKIQTKKEKHLVTAHRGASAGRCHLRASRQEVPTALPEPRQLLQLLLRTALLPFPHFFSNAPESAQFQLCQLRLGVGKQQGSPYHHPPCTPRFCSRLV